MNRDEQKTDALLAMLFDESDVRELGWQLDSVLFGTRETASNITPADRQTGSNIFRPSRGRRGHSDRMSLPCHFAGRMASIRRSVLLAGPAARAKAAL